MLHWIVGGLVLAYMLPKEKEEESASVGGGDPLALQCPVDTSLPPSGRDAVRQCWARGNRQDLEQFAAALGVSYPVARSSLLARAYELARAAEAMPASGTKQVVGQVGKTATAPVVKTRAEIVLEENKAAIAATANGKGLTPLVPETTAEVVEKEATP
jgi:hypothetical protein